MEFTIQYFLNLPIVAFTIKYNSEPGEKYMK